MTAKTAANAGADARISATFAAAVKSTAYVNVSWFRKMPTIPHRTTSRTSRRSTPSPPSRSLTSSASAIPAVANLSPENAIGLQRSNAYFVVA